MIITGILLIGAGALIGMGGVGIEWAWVVAGCTLLGLILLVAGIHGHVMCMTRCADETYHLVEGVCLCGDPDGGLHVPYWPAEETLDE